jgi:hypothetical protein
VSDTKHTFLSSEWFAVVGQILEEHQAATPPHAEAKINLVVTSTPFGDDVRFHMGSEGGRPLFGPGHLDVADVTMTTDYATAADVFVSGNPQAGMQAFMSGKVVVQGDMTKLMMAQAAGGGAGPSSDMSAKIQAVTEVPAAE